MGNVSSQAMATNDAPLDLSSCHYQEHSPLFGLLPGEIRNKIFAYSLVQYEDDSAAYPEDSYWYRPGFKGPKKSSSSLLRTCKLAYAEGQRVFLEELEWAFWFDRGPEGRSRSEACKTFFNRLSPTQVRDLKQVRFFTQMYWLEHGRDLNVIFANRNFRPDRLTITIRYSDWWWWESNAPLRMREEWLETFRGPPGLRELRVEYETLTWKKAEMMAIVERNKKWMLNIEDGGHLSAEDTQLEEWSWTGPSKLGGQSWRHHGEGDSMEYIVVTDTWRYVEGPIPEDKVQKQQVYTDLAFDSDDDDEDEGSTGDEMTTDDESQEGQSEIEDEVENEDEVEDEE